MSTARTIRLERLPWALLLAAFSGLWASCDSAVGEGRPNVVLITLDTLRADQLNAYGHADLQAPFLERLAREGTVFETAYSSSSWTAPSTASLLTGVYPDRHGVEQGFLVQLQDTQGTEEIRLQRIAPQTPTLAERLQAAGYSTFGVAANVNVGPEMEFDRGFGRFERLRQMSAEAMGELVLSWKEDLDAAEPFFLYMHLNDVHKPYELRGPWHQAAEGEPGSTLALYRSELGYMDHFLDRLHGELGLDEDDLIVVVSDHGEEFLDHGNWGHHFSLYGELSEIVFLVYGAGVRRGGRVTDPVSIIDVAPTLLELVGLELRSSEPRDGVSLAPQLRPGSASAGPVPARPLFGHRSEGGRELWSVISDGWKLIEGPEGVELYDLSRDPAERSNLAQTEPSKRDNLRSVLSAHRSRDVAHTSESTAVPIDPELLQHLKDIGYAR